MAEERHYDFANKVLDMLKDQAFSGINSEDIRLEKFPFDKQPSKGIAVSMIRESEGVGLNNRDDVRYGVQVTRIFPELHHSDGLIKNSDWRKIIWNVFHRLRIGFCEQEIITTVRPSTIHMPREWKSWNIDTSVMNIFSLVRETRIPVPKFTTQPQSVAVSSGTGATFTVVAVTEGVASITYAWKTRRYGTIPWIIVPGVSGPSLSAGPFTSADNGRQYRCIATNETGSMTSDIALVSVS